MKKIGFYFLLSLIWLLPNYSLGSSADKESDPNKEIGEKFIAAWDSHNAANLIALFKDDGAYEEVCSGRKYFGKGDISSYYNRTIEGMPDSKFEIVNIIAGKQQVSVEWTWQGTNSVGWPYMGISPTNKTMKIRGVSVIDIENRKIKNIRDYWDWNSFMKGIGLAE